MNAHTRERLGRISSELLVAMAAVGIAFLIARVLGAPVEVAVVHSVGMHLVELALLFAPSAVAVALVRRADITGTVFLRGGLAFGLAALLSTAAFSILLLAGGQTGEPSTVFIRGAAAGIAYTGLFVPAYFAAGRLAGTVEAVN